ncbi:hypothetical protein Tco_1487931, partial [Tanacetum coccineum]
VVEVVCVNPRHFSELSLIWGLEWELESGQHLQCLVPVPPLHCATEPLHGQLPTSEIFVPLGMKISLVFYFVSNVCWIFGDLIVILGGG